MSRMRTDDLEKTMEGWGRWIIKVKCFSQETSVVPVNRLPSLMVWKQKKQSVRLRVKVCMFLISRASLGRDNIFPSAPPSLCIHYSLFTNCCASESFQLNKVLLPRYCLHHLALQPYGFAAHWYHVQWLFFLFSSILYHQSSVKPRPILPGCSINSLEERKRNKWGWRDGKKMGGKETGGSWVQIFCWELNPSPLDEQLWLLTAELFL